MRKNSQIVKYHFGIRIYYFEFVYLFLYNVQNTKNQTSFD